MNVFASHVKEVGDQLEPSSDWYSAKKPKFDEVVASFKNLKMGWVHDVAFNQDGTMLAWVAHSATLSVMNSKNKQVRRHRWTFFYFFGPWTQNKVHLPTQLI